MALRGGSGARASNMKEVSGYGAWMARVRLVVRGGHNLNLPIDNIPQGSVSKSRNVDCRDHSAAAATVATV